MSQFILSLDQGTTSSRAIVFDHAGHIVGMAQKEFAQIYPQSGWVEHDAREIWRTLSEVALEVLQKTNLSARDIAAIGITNQRETTVLWDKQTGEPLHNAIVWQDRRTAALCESLSAQGHDALINQKTGLRLDPYFSASKLKWLLDNVAGARELAAQNRLAFGTIDTWLIWNLTCHTEGGALHMTDVSNASRTMLFNIRTRQWDEELLALFDIPASVLPEVRASSELYGHTSAIFDAPIAIAGIAGDQQAALFGQTCWQAGMVKNTYGTGCFMLMNTGGFAAPSTHNLLTTIAWQIGDAVTYALEGSIFIGGAVVQWLRDELNIINHARDIEELASIVPDSGGVIFVPAFAGLGAPHWNPNARGAVFGLSRGSSKAHLARAALDAVAHQTADVLGAMRADARMDISSLRVDGGASTNDLLMQIQADVLGVLKVEVVRPKVTETTALGAAYLAGLAVGYWRDTDEIAQLWQIDKTFVQKRNSDELAREAAQWQRAIRASLVWANQDECVSQPHT